MKELDQILKQLATNDIKKNAVMGAGIGAALNLGKGDVAKNALLGAGIGAALGWVLNEFTPTEKAEENTMPSTIIPTATIKNEEA